MNVAIIFAGGTGQRMNTSTKPKQFLELHGKPILVYTMEHYQRHEMIDGIVLVCVAGWLDYAAQLIETYHLTKVKAVVPGGATGQKSIYNGLKKAGELFPKDAIVLIHDGVRPLIDAETITNVIACVQEHGSAITVSPAIETITVKNGDNKVGEIIDRSQCMMAKAPQCFYLGEILKVHRKAAEENRVDFIDSASMMRAYGHELYTVIGPSENIKITTPMDYYIFRAIADAREDSQIFGL